MEKEREINTEELKRLAKKYAPNEPDFVKEVRFRQLYEEEDDGNIFAYCGTMLD